MASQPDERASNFSATFRRLVSCDAGRPLRVAPKPGLSYLDPIFVEELRKRLPAQTTACVMATFGISLNTWVKLRNGEAIRSSVAERLVERIDRRGSIAPVIGSRAPFCTP